VREATGRWFSPSGGNGGRQRLGWKRACARGRPGLAYKRTGRSVGVGRDVPVPLARVGRPRHGRRRAPLRRPMARHGRCAGRRINATWPSHLPWTARTSARRRCAVTSGHTSGSARAPEAGTARTAVADVAAHDVAPERVPAFPVLVAFH
jgi:hypothetical protein